MRLKNVKIGNQLLLGISIVLGLFITIGIVSYYQSDRIYHQNKLFYEHPFQIRKSVGVLNASIQKMRLATRDLMLAVNIDEKDKAVIEMELASIEAEEMFDIIKQVYLGPREDVENAWTAYLMWKNERDKNTQLAYQNDLITIKVNVDSHGSVGILREKMLQKINIIDQFSQDKGKEIHDYSKILVNKLNIQLIGFIGIALLITLIVYLLFILHIRNPIQKLTNTTLAFASGDYNTRNDYLSNNEIGELSNAFNVLAQKIMWNADLNNKSSIFATEMVQEEDSKAFFNQTLRTLMDYTSAQMSSVYLLNEQNNRYEEYFSIGIDNFNKLSFSKVNLEGEFGVSILTQKINHIKDLKDNYSSEFSTIVTQLQVNEIVTIPIVTSLEVVALISLGTPFKFNPFAIQFINKIYFAYSARIQGVLAYRKIKKYAEEIKKEKLNLSNLNAQLEAHKESLTLQSKALHEQNRELEMQKEQLKEVSKLKTSFLSNMSHELRTPLNSVIALSGVLSRKLQDQISEEEYSYLEVIQRNGKQLLTLINEILDISRIESGKEEFTFSQFNLCESINHVADMIRPQIIDNNLVIETAAGGSDIIMYSDLKKINHIIQNIIGNAVKFTEKGKISISVKKEDKMVKISIQDTGIGIKKENLEHIFDEFRQLDSGNDRKFSGTGLGLAIALKYAKLLGGSIEIESEFGIGSTFYIFLPIETTLDNN